MGGSAIQTFGKYQILDRIATGGMAEIYKARLEGIGGFQRTFAIKRILPNLSQNAEYIAMLVDEAKVAGLLSHANIVQILDLGQVDGIWYIAMEYVHGRDLGAVLRRAKQKGLWLPVPHAVFIAIELLKGLEYAHQRQVMRGGRPVALNIIHRDISPPNVLLSYQGEVKLTDFGIARANLRAMETVSGIVRGRFDYMSPEQAAGAKDLDQRSDLFSVGVVLYETLTGTHPFRADHEIQTVERVRTGAYVPVSQRNPEVPYALETIVDRALRVNREERYPSATAFKEALDKFFHDSGFIFTHTTLATYVKGLFPEAVNRPSAAPLPPRRAGPGDAPIRPLGGGPRGPTDAVTEIDELEVQDPTGTLDRRILTGVVHKTPPAFGMRPEQDPTDIRKRPAYDDFLDDRDDQETLIRKPPPGWDDPSTSALDIPDFLEEESQHETVIRRAPSLNGEADLVAEEPLPRATASRTDAGRNATGRRAPARQKAQAVGWLGWVFTGVGLGLGAFGGVVVGLLVAWLIGIGRAPADTLVRVVAPQGTQVRLDGDAVGAEVKVAPGVRHGIEILVRGGAPWKAEMTLQPGEQRVFVVVPSGEDAR